MAACGSGGQDLRSEGPTGVDDRVVEVSGDDEVVPAGGQTVGAGHAVLYGSYGIALDGSGDLWRSGKILDLDLDSGDRRWIEVPEDLWIAGAAATPAGLLVVGGPCSHADVVPADETDDVSCPERVTASYRMDWESEQWEPLSFDDGLVGTGAFPYLEGGGLVAIGDIAYLVLRTSADESSVFATTGGDGWSLIADDLGRELPPCATADGLIVLERLLDQEQPDQVTGQQLRQIDLDGSVQEIPLPDDVPNDSYGGISTVIGCLDSGPVLLYGGSSPTDDAPVSVVSYVDGAWIDVPGEFSVDSSGGLPSRISSNHGSVTFYLASRSGGGAVQRAAYLIASHEQGIELIAPVDNRDEASPEAEPYYLHDSTTSSTVRISYNLDSTIVSWN